jgi:hypothetical protein
VSAGSLMSDLTFHGAAFVTDGIAGLFVIVFLKAGLLGSTSPSAGLLGRSYRDDSILVGVQMVAIWVVNTGFTIDHSEDPSVSGGDASDRYAAGVSCLRPAESRTVPLTGCPFLVN